MPLDHPLAHIVDLLYEYLSESDLDEIFTIMVTTQGTTEVEENFSKIFEYNSLYCRLSVTEPPYVTIWFPSLLNKKNIWIEKRLTSIRGLQFRINESGSVNAFFAISDLFKIDELAVIDILTTDVEKKDLQINSKEEVAEYVKSYILTEPHYIQRIYELKPSAEEILSEVQHVVYPIDEDEDTYTDDMLFEDDEYMNE